MYNSFAVVLSDEKYSVTQPLSRCVADGIYERTWA